jgi:hypothetical protein
MEELLSACGLPLPFCGKATYVFVLGDFGAILGFEDPKMRPPLKDLYSGLHRSAMTMIVGEYGSSSIPIQTDRMRRR